MLIQIFGRTGILIPILLLASLTPLVVADPPPGASEVTNTICDEIPGTGIAYSPSHSTICDDWTWSDDDTPGSNWVVSEYAIEMDSLTQMSLDMEFAIYEFNRTLLNLEDLDLGGNSTDDDGIPADYIRNYFQLPTPSGSDVKETLRTEMGEIVEEPRIEVGEESEESKHSDELGFGIPPLRCCPRRRVAAVGLSHGAAAQSLRSAAVAGPPEG